MFLFVINIARSNANNIMQITMGVIKVILDSCNDT